MKKQKIVIVGGGSTGLSTAMNLMRLADNEVIVLEKSFIGSGQTGQCCGLVRSFYNKKEMAFSAHRSTQEIKIVAKNSADIRYVKKGLLVINALKEKKAMKENVKMMNSLGIKARYLEGQQLNDVNPFLKTENACAGFDQEAGYVNPRLVIDYLKNSCTDLGVKVIEKTKVTKITHKNNEFSVKTSRGEFKADKVINATAAFTNKINAFFDFQLPIKIIKTNNCFYRLPLGPQRYTVAIADFENLFYIIPHKEFIDVSSLVVDLNLQIDPEDKNVDKLDRHISLNYQKLISNRINGAERSSLLGGFGSYIDISPDYYPILGSIDEVPNYYFAAGFSGTGFKHFPVMGEFMAGIILGKKTAYSNLTSFFSYKRFANKNKRKKVSDSYYVKK